MASFAFDVFGGDMVRALCSGGKLVICPKEILLAPGQLLGLMRREEVDIAEFVPIVLRELVEYAEQTNQPLDFLRLAIVGSDAWYAADHKRSRKVLGANTRLVNSYGLTETTIDSSYFEGDVDCLADNALVPIGRPFPNVRLYVLDERMRPLPVGVPGELYIGGDGVSRGYVNSDLNAERFVEDPFCGARLCRTGDRARWRSDGQVEFLGRADNQVKIRGFRVEPGEVEQLLREHPQVAEAAVVARERTTGDLRLVAYVVGKSDTPKSGDFGHDGTLLDIAEMRRFLAQRVPDYMIPSALVTLSALPTTNSGKVDRRALPAPDWSRSSLCGEFVAPRTAVEEQLAAIWRELLNIERVGVHDSFFDLGGSSLSALRLTSRVRSTLAVDLPLLALFTAPTVAGLAEAIEKMPRAADKDASASLLPGVGNAGIADAVRLFDAFVLHGYGEAETMARVRAAGESAPRRWRSLLPLRPDGEMQPVFCIHGLGGHVAAFLPLARALPNGRPVFGLQGQGLEPGEEPQDQIETMAAFYASEIREAQPHGPYLLCGWSMGGLIALEIAQQFAADGEQTALVAMLDSYLSMADYDKLDLDDHSVIRWIAPHLGLSVAELKKLPIDRQWEQIAQAANLAQGIGVAEIRRLAAVCKAHLAAAASYRPRSYGGRAVLFRAGNAWGVQDRRWRSLCPQFQMETVPGDHYSILRRPDVDVLAGRLGRYLDSVAEVTLPAR
jgi:thioesterase domain-containing protein/acyl carrier protein